MGTKRPHPSSAVHPSRRPIVPNEPSTKKRKTNPHPSRTLQPSAHPINPLKSRIRSLERLLSHSTASDGSSKPAKPMPAGVRIDRERELASLRSQLQDAERAKGKKDMIGRFHMVRFFERKKAERRVRRAKTAIKNIKTGVLEVGQDEDSDLSASALEGASTANTNSKEKRRKNSSPDDTEHQLAAAEQRLHEAEVDLNYTLYCPLELAYSSLWPNAVRKKPKSSKNANDDDENDENDDEAETTTALGSKKEEKSKGDRDMWALVEKCMKEGKLTDLRNGKIVEAKAKLNANGAVKGASAVVNVHGKSGNARERARRLKNGKGAGRDGEDEDISGDEGSGGGFFE